jgi:decaprenyl-phosphate phosphoribosyltransferase
MSHVPAPKGALHVTSQQTDRPADLPLIEPAHADRPGGILRGIAATARPRQWAKNLLVFAAPATGSVLTDPAAVLATFAAFVAFCLVASGVYCLNDVIDAKEDRLHPVKRHRPVAAGAISARTATAAGTTFIIFGLVVAAVGGGAPLVGVLAAYLGLSVAYMVALRGVALLDIAAIAGGFLLRAVAGGVAADVELSMWFLMVAGFGSLFLAAGKRRAEYVQLGDERTSHRRSLLEYTDPYLRYVQYASSTVAIAAYAQWAFEGPTGGSIWSELSIIPFVLGIFRYALLLEGGRGAAPEDVVLGDAPLLVLGAAWVVLVAVGVYQ